jgi:hypothetical protein
LPQSPKDSYNEVLSPVFTEPRLWFFQLHNNCFWQLSEGALDGWMQQFLPACLVVWVSQCRCGQLLALARCRFFLETCLQTQKAGTSCDEKM